MNVNIRDHFKTLEKMLTYTFPEVGDYKIVATTTRTKINVTSQAKNGKKSAHFQLTLKKAEHTFRSLMATLQTSFLIPNDLENLILVTYSITDKKPRISIQFLDEKYDHASLKDGPETSIEEAIDTFLKRLDFFEENTGTGQTLWEVQGVYSNTVSRLKKTKVKADSVQTAVMCGAALFLCDKKFNALTPQSDLLSLGVRVYECIQLSDADIPIVEDLETYPHGDVHSILDDIVDISRTASRAVAKDFYSSETYPEGIPGFTLETVLTQTGDTKKNPVFSHVETRESFSLDTLDDSSFNTVEHLNFACTLLLYAISDLPGFHGSPTHLKLTVSVLEDYCEFNLYITGQGGRKTYQGYTPQDLRKELSLRFGLLSELPKATSLYTIDVAYISTTPSHITGATPEAAMMAWRLMLSKNLQKPYKVKHMLRVPLLSEFNPILEDFLE